MASSSRQPDGLNFAEPKRTFEGFVEIIEHDETENLIIADDFAQRPSGLPPLFAMFNRRLIMRAIEGIDRFGETAPQRLQKRGQMIEQNPVVNALCLGLFLNGPMAPTVDDDPGIPLDHRADFGDAVLRDA